MAAPELFGRANAAYVDENYSEAVTLYTQALEESSENDEYLSSRSQAYIKLERYEDGLADAEKALEINSSNSKAFLRKGICKLHLGDITAAKEALEAGQKLDSTKTAAFDKWLKMCSDKLPDSNQDKQDGDKKAATEKSETESPPAPSSAQPAPSAQSVPSAQPEAPSLQLSPPSSKTRYDWYQTEGFVVVTILIKKVQKDDLTVNIQPNSLSVTIKMPSGSDYSLELDLSHEIVPDKSITKVMGSKVEIKLRKKDGIQWKQLEGDSADASVKQFTPEASGASTAANKYPSSSHYTRNWDALVADIKKEEKEEKPEGDAAINALFQQIYSDGSDEVKKAMNKSFMESGGTVLSTNWEDIQKKKTEIKPPDGMEYKKWQQ